jgi:hypothetical protein
MNHEDYVKILFTLNNCAVECNHCAMACLEEPDVKKMAASIKLNIDCAEICRITATFASRGSMHAQHIMKECIEICLASAAECDKHSHVDHCKECADACRKCADMCKGIIG